MQAFTILSAVVQGILVTGCIEGALDVKGTNGHSPTICWPTAPLWVKPDYGRRVNAASRR